jgi:LTXXQ motif family protein
MPTVSASLGVIALAFITLFPTSQAAHAFGLNFGPFHLYVPIPGGHPRSHVARTEPTATETPQGATTPAGPPSLLYPVLAWPSIYDEIFAPSASSSWSFGYQNIFDQAFAKYAPQRSADLCPYRDRTADIVGRITKDTSPDAKQQPLLQKLATALGQANGYLIKSCPTEIPAQPVARLQLMVNQLDAMIMALEIVRPPLQAFEQSLSDEQRTRFAGAGLDGIAPACKTPGGSPQRSLADLERAVQPTDAQRPALAKVEDAFNRAQANLDADCPGAVSRTALGRLEATEERLDAAWRAAQTIQVALADFQKTLSDEQNARFNSLQLASVR